MYLPQNHTSFPKQAQSDKIWNQYVGCNQQEKLERIWIPVTLLGMEAEFITQTQNSVFFVKYSPKLSLCLKVCVSFIYIDQSVILHPVRDP